jgi:RNA polymerase sigma factor (sigma-70 family)
MSRNPRARRSQGVRLPPFQRFLDTHRDAVYRYLVFTIGPNEADDAFQETFIAALRAYPKLTSDENLKGWVLRIAHNKAIDLVRARGRRPVPVEELPDLPAPPDPAPAGLDPGLWDRVRELPPKQRGAVVLRFVGDLSHGEIGLALDCSEEAARRNLHAGLERLRKEVAR